MEQIPAQPETQHPDQDLVLSCQEVAQRLDKIYEDVIFSAFGSGLDSTGIKSLLVAGWNADTYPRLVRGDSFRGGGYDLIILHGAVPSDIFDHFEEDEGLGLVMPDECDPKGAIRLVFSHDIATRPNPDDPQAFYIETLHFPQFESHNKNPGRLAEGFAKISAVMGRVQE